MLKDFFKFSLSKKLLVILIVLVLGYLAFAGIQSTIENSRIGNNYQAQYNLQRMNKNKDQAIFIAIQDNNLQNVKQALKMNNNIEVRNSLGETPLLTACQRSNLDIIKFLVEKGANIKAIDNRGDSVLHKALGFWFTTNPKDSKLSVIQYLVDNGADVNVRDNIGNSPILEAVNANSVEIMDYLISKGANIKDKNKAGNHALILAVSNARVTPEMIKYYTSKGISINAANNNGETALTYAIRRGNQMPNFSLINLLAENGANINTKDKEGKTILMYAAATEPRTSPIAEWKQTGPNSVDALIKKGLPVNATDNTGKTALMYAAEANNCANVLALIKAGAIVNQEDKNGKSAIFYAAGNNTTDVLVNRGANINAQDNNGKTALMYAKDYKSAETLIANQANYKIKDKQGKTAANYAKENAKLNIFNLLNSPNPYQNLTKDQIHCSYYDEVHYVGVYNSSNVINVKVSTKNKPIVLVLSSYEPVQWNIIKMPDSKIKKVIISGYYPQTYKGLSPTTPVINLSFTKNQNDYMHFQVPTSNRNEYFKLVDQIEQKIGVRPKTIQGNSESDYFEVNGKNTIEIVENQENKTNTATKMECRLPVDSPDSCLLLYNLAVSRGAAVSSKSQYKGKLYLEARLSTNAFNLDYYDANVGLDGTKLGNGFPEIFDYRLPEVKENKLRNGDTIGVAMDLDNAKLYFYKNGELNSRYNSIQIKKGMEYWVGAYAKSNNTYWAMNFGATPFKYPIPAGFKAFDSN